MLVRIAMTSVLLALSGSAFAETHAMIDQSRSSFNKTMFVTTSVEGETGTMEKTLKGSNDVMSESWHGYGIRNGVGVEAFKFIQFSLSHTLINMRSADSSLETLSGSRLSAEIAFEFSAPLTNIEFGLGMLGDNLTYLSNEKSGTVVGSGHFYSMGINYFLTPSVSFQATGKRLEVNNQMSGGSSDINKLSSKTDSLSAGIAIWL
ncbi:MAG: hypothetical protein H7249_17570 [Chitinophagaceae bacterium]|nr:hypothetical protein [Oligoflexus sp.]